MALIGARFLHTVSQALLPALRGIYVCYHSKLSHVAGGLN